MLLVIISGFNIYGTTSVPIVAKTTKLSPGISKFVFKNTDGANDYSFANEALPVNDASVNLRLKRSLLKHNYRHVQSTILQSKADKLFPIIEPILKAYGIPDDFKYIPLVESGLCEGTSIKGAKGLWQFMPGTARTYGLRVRNGIDERLNVRKSTIAACKYIKELYGEFNSWTLAAAAYNNGSIKLEKAINRQNEDNYFRMHLNRETGAYVYNLIAMKAIISHPQKYGYDYYKVRYFNPASPELLAAN
ncbi:lytic transglycosylase domain-containing protein [Mucilaginibacter sp.]|uniref:lytic transglycosylase domain-containing protein n=1 Tax=Mucilaginibacter sp. TaxID=1882438 RepID=UPI003D11056A